MTYAVLKTPAKSPETLYIIRYDNFLHVSLQKRKILKKIRIKCYICDGIYDKKGVIIIPSESPDIFLCSGLKDFMEGEH